MEQKKNLFVSVIDICDEPAWSGPAMKETYFTRNKNILKFGFSANTQYGD